ncbi:MAG: endopeptidase La [Deltaproteobacteria bacterium]|nr:endopeptidase La [Deltaproteobacteria bacterium]NND29351.1 endopeptidase La [Myxococcales bacterium]MBT8463411.1 endopeptidase La [Deltaproteobacteria bacterium]NNK09435.1 endopeptidase La [Myxococcales bacterium]NNK41448.1 endopeptidase La [Myxococcales bacterium]
MSDEEETIASIPPPDTGEIEFGSELPVLPIRNAVLFPAAVAPFDVGREKSVALVEDIENLDQPIIAIVAQRDPSTDDPDQSDLYPVGVAARVLKALKHSSGNYSLILQGLVRIRLEQMVTSEPYIRARVSRLEEPAAEDVESEALAMSLRDIAKQVIQLMPELPREAGSLIDSIQEHGQLADLVAANLDAPVEEKSQLLETLDAKERIRKVLRLLTRQLEILKMRERINSQIKEEMGKNQREYVLRQQLKAIKEELGEEDGDQGDLDVLEERLAKANLPGEADKVAHKQLKRLRQMQVGSAEYTVVRTYIDWILDIPWSKQTSDNMDIAAVRKVLDEDHSGLEKVKKRIVEYLAVRKLKTDKKGPILCLIGPPGVGKTSLGRSVARALGRRFHRISLGGVHDEAAIRGHRRTYVGALPGQVIQGMKKAGTVNPVFMLDEIDKIGHDFRGDPAAALLEVLDPEQNDTFSDHYLEIPYDLSKVMFIATGNVGDTIPAPLRDRMEIIEIPSYTRREKSDIARVHLVPKQLEEHGIKPEQVTLQDGAVESIIDHYTREAGVRNLERQIASVIRGVAVKVAEGEEGPWVISDEESLRPYLGAPRFSSEVAERTAETGVATGLAWTSVGGEILFIECTRMHGTGKLQLTGQLGDVMKESAQTAMSYVRTRAKAFGIPEDFLEKSDIHIHIPAGAMPKDGPSAGVTMMTAIVSLLTGIHVRHDVAMTGEITLRGRVLPVGGVKEKVLAAHRAGIKRVILPERNAADLDEVPEEVRETLEFVPVSKMDAVLANALLDPDRLTLDLSDPRPDKTEGVQPSAP